MALLARRGRAGLATGCERRPMILPCFGRVAEAEQKVVDEANCIGTGALGRDVARGEMLSQVKRKVSRLDDRLVVDETSGWPAFRRCGCRWSTPPKKGGGQAPAAVRRPGGRKGRRYAGSWRWRRVERGRRELSRGLPNKAAGGGGLYRRCAGGQDGGSASGWRCVVVDLEDGYPQRQRL